MINELNENVINALEILGKATLNETRQGFEFQFENSNKCNYCKVVKYHNSFIIQFRKRGNDNFTNESYDKLVYEKVIKPQEFVNVFEKVTGIYLSGLY